MRHRESGQDHQPERTHAHTAEREQDRQVVLILRNIQESVALLPETAVEDMPVRMDRRLHTPAGKELRVVAPPAWPLEEPAQ